MIAGFGRDFFETDNMYFQGKYKNSEKMGSVPNSDIYCPTLLLTIYKLVLYDLLRPYTIKSHFFHFSLPKLFQLFSTMFQPIEANL